ncbi:ABC transporter substrate-binding protein [Georgenia yuyongxinii]|uniref:ABC transporter substrate-binding protein n=1 Tax=Georgenia yuyongxinii TaxID=2589797 RepID=UPI00163DB7F0|nr:ABC transporter substrate-binding protein [Georgenia yuyongxinii]
MKTAARSQRGRRPRPSMLVAALLALLVLAGCSQAQQSDAATTPASTDGSEPLEVGILLMLQAQVVDDMSQAFQDELTARLGSREVTFEVRNANGDPNLVNSITKYFAGSDADAFAVLGTPAVIAMAQQIPDRPIFALGIGDPVHAGVAESLEQPGGNVTGSIDFVNPQIILDEVLKIQPGVTALGTVFNPSNDNLRVWVDLLKDAVAQHPEMTLVEATVSGTPDVAAAARSLAGRTDAVLIGPDAQVIAGMSAVAAVGSTSGIPVYQTSGAPDIAGVLASIGPDYAELGARTGEVAAVVLGGQSASSTPFYVPDGAALTINGTTLESLPLEVPASVLGSAEVIE